MRHLKTFACSYQNGNQGVSNLHFSDPGLYHVWDLEHRLPLGDGKKDITVHNTKEGSIEQWLLHKWEGEVIELTSVQAVTPWFDFRIGFLMGMMHKNALLAVKFKLIDDAGDNYTLILFNK